MAIIRAEEARDLSSQQVEEKISQLQKEYYSELGKVSGGGRPENTGRVRELRRTIARLLTIISEAGSKRRKASGKRAARIAAAREKPKEEKKKQEKKQEEKKEELEVPEKNAKVDSGTQSSGMVIE